jgi:hypothetical protein
VKNVFELWTLKFNAMGSQLKQLTEDYDLRFTGISNDVCWIENSKCNIQSMLKELVEKNVQITPNSNWALQFYNFNICQTQHLNSGEHVIDQKIPIQITRFKHQKHQLTTIWVATQASKICFLLSQRLIFIPWMG